MFNPSRPAGERFPDTEVAHRFNPSVPEQVSWFLPPFPRNNGTLPLGAPHGVEFAK